MRRVLSPAALLATLLVAAGLPTSVTAPADAAQPHTSVFARIPSPGYPAYVFAHRNHRVYVGTYEAGDRQRSKVFEYSSDGALLHSWVVPGQRLGTAHGVQVANQTHDGRLVLLESSTRRVLTLDPVTGRFRRVAQFPKGVVPNYATWGPRNLFVTDYGDGGGIWRVLPDGRVRRWLVSPQLTGVLGFGTTGLVYREKQHDFLVDQSTISDGSGLPTNGVLYRVPIRHGRPGRLTALWTSRPTDLPDGFGVARSGHVYVGLSGLDEQVVELSAKGREIRRIGTAVTGENGSPIPFDSPCSATFHGTSILVANQSALMGDATHMAVLKVDVGERGIRQHVPRSARFRR